MLAHKADRHHHQFFDALLAQLFQRLFGVGLQPLHRAHTALVGQGPGVLPAQGFHDQLSAAFDLLLIGIAGFFHVALGHPVGAEEDVGGAGINASIDFPLDQLGHRLEVARVVVPAADRSQRQLGKALIALAQALQFPEARTTGADGEVGIQRQHHHLLNAVGLHVRHRGFGEGVPIAHGHVGGGIHIPLSQQALQLARLLIGDAA